MPQPPRKSRSSRRRRPVSRERGFTLAELMMSLAIGAILLSVAVPSYSSFVRNTRQTASANELLATLHFARELAVTRNARITVCGSSDGTTCAADTWADGWITFQDANDDRVVDAGESVERRGTATPLLDIGSSDFGTFLIYRPNGRAMVSTVTQSTGAFTLCDDRGAAHARTVLVDLSGRPRVSDRNLDGSAPTCP